MYVQYEYVSHLLSRLGIQPIPRIWTIDSTHPKLSGFGWVWIRGTTQDLVCSCIIQCSNANRTVSFYRLLKNVERSRLKQFWTKAVAAFHTEP